MRRAYIMFLVAQLGAAGCGSATVDANHADSVKSPETSGAPSSSSEPVSHQAPQVAKPAPKPKSAYTVFAIDSTKLAGKNINVAGHTDLPDGAKLIINVSIVAANDTDPCYPTDGDVKVKDGKWSISLPVPSNPEFKSEPHVVNASWTPVNEDESVLALTGHNGEKLQGPAVKKPFKDGTKMFDLEKRIRLNLGRPEPDSLPKVAGLTGPKRAVALILNEWQRHSWHSMAKSVCRADPSTDSERLDMCKAHFEFWNIHAAEIKDVDYSSDPAFNLPGNIAKVTVHVKAFLGTELKDEDMVFVVLRLGEDNRPSSNGRWAVNIDAVGPA